MLYCTQDEVLREIKNQGMSAADLQAIAERIPRACALVDGYCGQSFGDEAVQNEVRRGDQVRIDDGGNLRVTSKKANVQSIAIASISNDMRNWTLLPLDAVDIDRYVITFVGANLPFGRSAHLWLRMSYQGGYAAGTLPLAIVNAAVRWTSFLYHKRDAPFDITSFPSVGQVVIPSAIPPDIVQVLQPFVRVTP